MLHHVGIKVSNLETSREFYRKALEPLGFSIMLEEAGAYLGMGKEAPELWLSQAQEGNVSQRCHVAFTAASQEQVDTFYSAAMEVGGHDNGAPGPRPDYGPNYYAAFVRDPDGNNIEATYLGGSQS